MNSAILLPIAAALALGIWTVFHDKASGKIDNLYGAIVVSLTAVLLGLVFLIPKLKSGNIQITKNGLIFSVLAGVTALAIDYFALKAYSSGLEITIVGPIIIGGSIVVASIIGLFLGESISLMKFLGIFLVILGSGILAMI